MNDAEREAGAPWPLSTRSPCPSLQCSSAPASASTPPPHGSVVGSRWKRALRHAADQHWTTGRGGGGGDGSPGYCGGGDGEGGGGSPRTWRGTRPDAKKLRSSGFGVVDASCCCGWGWGCCCGGACCCGCSRRGCEVAAAESGGGGGGTGGGGGGHGGMGDGGGGKGGGGGWSSWLLCTMMPNSTAARKRANARRRVALTAISASTSAKRFVLCTSRVITNWPSAGSGASRSNATPSASLLARLVRASVRYEPPLRFAFAILLFDVSKSSESGFQQRQQGVLPNASVSSATMPEAKPKDEGASGKWPRPRLT